MISQRTAQAWVERWDSQQQQYRPDREDRFTAMLDAVEESAGRPDPLVLDLGSGPGSLAIRYRVALANSIGAGRLVRRAGSAAPARAGWS